MPDAWDEGFETWSGEDAFENIDRDELLRLARELAAQRDADRAAAQAEIEGLKRALRERAEQIATRERELTERERAREDAGERRGRRRLRRRDRDDELEERRGELDDQAYELAERAAAVAEREHELARLSVRLERELSDAERRGRGRFRRKAADPETPPVSVILDAREHELAERAVALEKREQEGAKRLTERESALASRAEALDEREAALRAQADALDARARELDVPERAHPALRSAAEPASPDDEGERERKLAQREAKVAARERELALIRQSLDAERNALLAREREARRRVAAEDREALAPPLAPLGFSEGLSAFAANRMRRSTPARRYR